jgi:hypothetical protein
MDDAWFKQLIVDEMMILKLMQYVRMWTGCNEFTLGSRGGFSEHSNGRSGSKKDRLIGY